MEEEVNFFDYSDDGSMCSISRAVRDNNKAELKKILLKRKAKKTARTRLAADNRGWTAVHIAASRKECAECLELLLRYSECIDLDINAASFEGKTALFVACEESCDENVLSLLKKGADANAKTLDGTSPLHVASIKGYTSIARYLLQYGAAVNEQDWQGFTSLHLAALYDRLGVCETLLQNEADTRTLDSDGNLALHLACQSGNSRIVRLLLEKSGDHDADVGRRNEVGITPLMLAARSGRDEECVRELLQRGACASTTSKDGFVALQYAAFGGNAAVLRTLLDQTDYVVVEENCFRRASYVLNNEGIFYSLVCCALASSSVDCLRLLLESGLDRKILEAPYVENSGGCVDVFSPLAYLFSVRCDCDGDESADETLSQLVRLLLQHNIVYMDTFVDELKIEWPLSPPGRVSFLNPYAIVFNAPWTDAKKFAYSDVLNRVDVTVDYCLRCYNTNNASTSAWDEFDVRSGYENFYKPVLEAVADARVDLIRLYLSHSRILEPDRLCEHLVVTKLAEFARGFDAISNKVRSAYDYLVQLKPTYYKYDRYPSAVLIFDSASRAEEFSRSNLQQLCRSVIRKQLRGVTLIDNLRTFHRKILDLPLPSRLKDYLLFRS